MCRGKTINHMTGCPPTAGEKRGGGPAVATPVPLPRQREAATWQLSAASGMSPKGVHATTSRPLSKLSVRPTHLEPAAGAEDVRWRASATNRGDVVMDIAAVAAARRRRRAGSGIDSRKRELGNTRCIIIPLPIKTCVQMATAYVGFRGTLTMSIQIHVPRQHWTRSRRACTRKVGLLSRELGTTFVVFLPGCLDENFHTEAEGIIGMANLIGPIYLPMMTGKCSMEMTAPPSTEHPVGGNGIAVVSTWEWGVILSPSLGVIPIVAPVVK